MNEQNRLDYSALYDGYWQRADRIGEHSGDLQKIATLVTETCGYGSAIDVGCGEGFLVAELLNRGIDAIGFDVSSVAVERANQRWHGRFIEGSVLSMPFPDARFDIVVSTDCMEHLAPADVPAALREMYRISSRYVFLQIATAPDRDNHWHLTIENRAWWEARCFEAGFRKHPLYYRANPYEALNQDSWQILILLEKVPTEALKKFDLATLVQERLLHTDMLREVGRRSDAHCIRYHKAAEFIRPGDRVLDVACGLGYGSHMLYALSQAHSVLGVDFSDFAIAYANAHYGQSGTVAFCSGDAQALDAIADHSVDFITAFETIEHVQDPIAYLRQLQRVLTPGGRIMVCAPNNWVDETGRDPNPHHLHVYSWQRLVSECSRFFLLENGFLQTAGGALKCPSAERQWTSISADAEPQQESEWVLLLGMSDPLSGQHLPYQETAWQLPDSAAFNVAAFARDYQNPWLVKSMVAMGMRMRSQTQLVQLQERVMTSSSPQSVDYAAALCGWIYSCMNTLEMPSVMLKGIEAEILRYAAIPEPSAHQLRWQVSLLFAGGELARQQGRVDDAVNFYAECTRRDVARYSPLLGNKVIDAFFWLAILALSRHDATTAKNYLRDSIAEVQRLVSGDWINIIGRHEHPLPFGLAEMAQLLDKAARAAYLLTALDRVKEAHLVLGTDANGFFERQINEHKKWVDTLAHECEHLVDRISALNHQMSSLSLALTERDQQMSTLSLALTERDQQMSTLSLALAERDQQMSPLNLALAERDQQLGTLNAALAERDHQISTLGLQLADRDTQIERISTEANSLYVQLTQVLRSRSWMITRPFRVLLRVLHHGPFYKMDQASILKIARSVGRILPISLSLKSTLRNALVHRLHKNDLKNKHNSAIKSPSLIVNEPPQVVLPRRYMVAECCGLQSGLVSVVLPVYNQSNLISASIDSVLTQSYENFELIIVNDGSTDGVEAVLEQYKHHPKVKFFTQLNQRLPKALSNGFSFASGEFWTWTSADNIMEPRMLECLVRKLQLDPDLGMVYADYYAIDDQGDLLQDSSWRQHNRPSPASGEIRLPRNTRNLNSMKDNFIGPCFMYRGWIGRIVGDYDPQLGIEDYDYWMRINAFFKVSHLDSDDLLYRYRVHENTLSARAHEHRIHEKAQRLMEYEIERAKFFSQPFAVLADVTGLDWVNSHRQSTALAGTLINQHGTYCAEATAAADLLVISSNVAIQYLDALLGNLTPIAIIFSPNDICYQRVQRLLNQPNCIALVSTEKDAARVRLVATPPVIDIRSSQAFEAVQAFAKIYRFFHLTRTSEELKRDLPTVLANARSKHVLLQVDSFTQGGMENVVIDLGVSLQAAGFEVTIGNLGKSGDMVSKARERGLRVEECFSHFSEPDYLDWLKQNRVHLVNAHYSIFGAQACHDAGIPFVETIHNSYVWLDPETIQHYRSADRYIASYICVSKTVALYADAVLGLDVTKMQVVANGIDSGNVDASNLDSNRIELRREWKVGPQAPVFLNVASIMATKAQLPLVQAFAHVVRQLPEARLVLLGSVMESTYFKAVEKEVKALKLQSHVIFAGYHREVAPYYHAADVFVLPSYWEGWSLSLGEAMANGLAGVITDVGSAYEFSGRRGVQIVEPPFGDITQLNYLNLGSYIYKEDVSFNQRLGAAMLAVTKEIPDEPRSIDRSLAQKIDSSVAYKKYADIFSSLH